MPQVSLAREHLIETKAATSRPAKVIRVKVPAILDLTRLGYTYLFLKGLEYHETSNIPSSSHLHS